MGGGEEPREKMARGVEKILGSLVTWPVEAWPSGFFMAESRRGNQRRHDSQSLSGEGNSGGVISRRRGERDILKNEFVSSWRIVIILKG